MTGPLAKFICDLNLANVPSAVKREARRLVLDTLGCMLGGTRTRMAPIADGTAALMGSGDAASVVGRPTRASLAAALYANGRLANCMDFDETFPIGVHFGIGAVVAALALSEEKNATGAEFLQAVIAGYELGGRVASVTQPDLYVKKRFPESNDVPHFSSSVVFASAGAAIQLEKQDKVVARHTLGLAATATPVVTSGKYATTFDMPDCKYEDAGWSTLAGVVAARTASLGATGFTDIFEGDRGFVWMCGLRDFDPDRLVGDLGTRWMLTDITYKPWPTCRWTHQPLTALTRAAARAQFDPRHIESVTLYSHGVAMNGRFNNPTPRTFVSRQFSLQHAATMLLLGVPVGAAWMDEAQDENPDVLQLRSKVRIEEWDRANEYWKYCVRGGTRQMPARAVIVLKDGRRLQAETEFALGDPWSSETAWGDEQVATKFRSICGLPEAQAAKVICNVLAMEAQPDVQVIASALRAL